MKKGFLGILIFFLILFSFSVYATHDPSILHKGANVCNINRDCGGPSDGFCPELFFTPGESCYIEDPDCCKIKKASWSSSQDSLVPVTNIKEGQKAYMYIETSNCEEKNTYFELYCVKDKLFGDTEYKSKTYNPIKVTSTNKLSIAFIGYEDPTCSEKGATNFKFKVNINPSAESELIIVKSEELPATSSSLDNSCRDGIDNDADGCADEVTDCADNFENNPDPVNDCGAGSACAGWKCSFGDCLNGIKSVNCPVLPGCNLDLPPSVKCYEKTVPFPFFSKFNVGIVILLLIGYYGFNIYRKKKKS